jgi:hypothetical protein
VHYAVRQAFLTSLLTLKEEREFEDIIKVLDMLPPWSVDHQDALIVALNSRSRIPQLFEKMSFEIDIHGEWLTLAVLSQNGKSANLIKLKRSGDFNASVSLNKEWVEVAANKQNVYLTFFLLAYWKAEFKSSMPYNALIGCLDLGSTGAADKRVERANSALCNALGLPRFEFIVKKSKPKEVSRYEFAPNVRFSSNCEHAKSDRTCWIHEFKSLVKKAAYGGPATSRIGGSRIEDAEGLAEENQEP